VASVTPSSGDQAVAAANRVDATAELLDEHPAMHASGRLSARLVVATIESLVHRLIASPDPVDPQQLEDEIVLLLSGYLSGTRSFTAV
jgi:Tetracyclin repressor-like, C-terminal domain